MTPFRCLEKNPSLQTSQTGAITHPPTLNMNMGFEIQVTWRVTTRTGGLSVCRSRPASIAPADPR